ncbi:uncharacterized protein [Antedon mediterranea]|uniref:uncharacterized protein n=1 Tax=Antedon mediterranea TaxID=105859 RepID=UPI003AF598C1
MRGNGYSEDSAINDTPSLNRLLRDALVERTEAEIESLKRRLQEELETTEGQFSHRTKQETKRGQSDGIVSLYVLSKELAEVQRQREISDMKKQMDIQGRKK